MNYYILLNNIIFNHADLSDKLELKNSINPNQSCYCDDDYNKLLNEIQHYLSNKTDVTLVVGSYFYNLPCFTDLLSDKLKSVKIIPLIFFFVENNNFVKENEEITVNEVYNHFVIKTTCKVANKALTIVSQKCENFDFDNELLGKIQWKNQNLSVEEKHECITIDKVSCLNKASKNANAKEDFADLNCCDSKINADFTLLCLFQNIAEILKQSITDKNKQLIFNPLLYLNGIEKYNDNWATNWINLSDKQTTCRNELKIKEASFETETLPDKRYFTVNDKFWLMAEGGDFTCIFSRKNSNGTIQTGKFGIPSKFLSKIAFNVKNKSIVKLFLEIRKDIFNNLNVVVRIDNKQYYNKIIFQDE
jgi:hypothetical protein